MLRFCITDEDWGFVIIAAILGYAIPFLFGMKVGNVPLEMVGWIITMGLTILTLNIIRRKSRPARLRHVIQAKLQGTVSRRRLPGGATPTWLKQDQESE
ncbi:MAG: hypothetical protein ABI977_16090 [Acidobacteriota bacterium]